MQVVSRDNNYIGIRLDKAKVIIDFTYEITNPLDLYSIVYYYIKNPDNIVTKILLRQYISPSTCYYNDVTAIKEMSFLGFEYFFVNKLRYDSSISETHISSSDSSGRLELHLTFLSNVPTQAPPLKKLKHAIIEEIINDIKDRYA